MPAGASETLDVRTPFDTTVLAFAEYNGVPTFAKADRVYTDLTIGKFWGGTSLNTQLLRSQRMVEIEAWNGRAAQLMDAWNQFLPPKIYDMLTAGQTAISGGHFLTGGSAFFATDHYYNVKHTGLGTFSNLIDDGGALASTPIYAIISGGPFSRMYPWQIRKGAGPADSLTRGGIPHNASPGMPWVVKWIPRSESEIIESNFETKLGVYAELGWGLLCPHTIIRFEGTLNYAGLKSIVDNARARKDLNGYNPASQIGIAAILCEASQVSTINGLLGREVTDTGARQVDLRIDSALQGAAVIPMSR